MRKTDIPQVKEIDREAFPTMMPPPNFERELGNQMMHYYVVCDESRTVNHEPDPVRPMKKPTWMSSLMRRLFGGAEASRGEPPITVAPFVCGYVGFWIMADEAHITTIAVRQECQRNGVGELLMVTVFVRAKELFATQVTLEVRVTNTGAQQLYLKYGFKEAGVRKHYYTDNREDAYIMTTQDITTDESLKMLDKLRRQHAGRWGKAKFSLSEN